MMTCRALRALCLLLAAMLALPVAFAEPAPYGEAINTFLKALTEMKVLPETDTLPSLSTGSDFEASELSINLTDFLLLYVSTDESGALLCELYTMLADMPDSVDTDSLYQSYLKSFDPSLTDEAATAALAQLQNNMRTTADGYALNATLPLPNFTCTMTLGQTEAVETLSILLP